MISANARLQLLHVPSLWSEMPVWNRQFLPIIWVQPAKVSLFKDTQRPFSPDWTWIGWRIAVFIVCIAHLCLLNIDSIESMSHPPTLKAESDLWLDQLIGHSWELGEKMLPRCQAAIGACTYHFKTSRVGSIQQDLVTQKVPTEFIPNSVPKCLLRLQEAPRLWNLWIFFGTLSNQDGVRASQPQKLPQNLVGKPLFPHVSFKNTTLHVNFGSPLALLGTSCTIPCPISEFSW